MKTKWERLLDLYDEIEDDSSWGHLRMPGVRLVRGDGGHTAETARVMVVGQNPGAQENGRGVPFVGLSGQVLNQLLARAGLHRHEVFVTNVVKYKTPGNRPLTQGEVHGGIDALRVEWQILKPRLTIAVGQPAWQAIGAAGLPFSQTPKGQLFPYPRYDAYITAQYHPAFGLRNAAVRPKMERDWEELGRLAKEVGGILCPECEGASAREGVACHACKGDM